MCLMFFKEGIVKKLIKALPIFWLICGVAFAAASYVGYCQLRSSDDNAKQMTHHIQSKQQSQQQLKNKNQQAVFDPDQIKPVTPSEYAAAQLQYEDIVNNYGIGSIYIPSARVQTKILAGMANQNLMVAVGTYYPDQLLGKGNYVLLAHNLVEGGGALGNLPNTKLGHVIYATDFSTVFEYTAKKNEVVNQASGQLLEKPEDNKPALITLFRCEGALNTPNRALVQGEFVRSYPASEASNDVKIGLGLGAMTEKARPEESSGQTAQEIKKNTDRDQRTKQFKQEKPSFSLFEKIAIICFSMVNKYPLLFGFGFLIILFILQHTTRNGI